MKALKKFNDLTRTEKIDDLRIFFREYELFEEIPIVSRNNRLNKLVKAFGDETQRSMISFSLFYLNQILICAKIKKYSNFFIAITFPDIEYYGEQYIIPNLMVSRKPELFSFLKEQKPVSIDRYKDIYYGFEACGVLDSFVFFEGEHRLTAVIKSIYDGL